MQPAPLGEPSNESRREIPPFFVRASREMIAEAEALLNSGSSSSVLERVREQLIREVLAVHVDQQTSSYGVEARPEVVQSLLGDHKDTDIADLAQVAWHRLRDMHRQPSYPQDISFTPPPGDHTPLRTSFAISDVQVMRDLSNFHEIITGLGYSSKDLFGSYLPTSPPIITLHDRGLEFFLTHEQECQQCMELIDLLCGRIPERREEVFAHFGGFPFYGGAEQLRFEEGRAHSHLSYSSLRFSFGSLNATRRFFELRQAGIDLGQYESCTVEVSGRVDLEFLRWLRSEGINDTSPVPDIELVYLFPLPSGERFSFTLKEARGGSRRPPNDYSRFSEEDRNVITGLRNYFAIPRNRSCPLILTNLSEDHFDSEWKEVLPRTSGIHALPEYIRFEQAYRDSLCAQALEYVHPSMREEHANGWRSSWRRTFEDFEEVVLEQLEGLPFRQAFYSPDFFILSPEELVSFRRKTLPLLYAICSEEVSRIEQEAADNTHIERIEEGYAGRVEGYALPLDYMLMDMIIDLRKKESFRKKRAKRDGLPEDQIKVPYHIGRSYEKPDRFLSTEDLPAALHKSTARREVQVIVSDPLAEHGIVHLGENDLPGLSDYILETNLARLGDVFDQWRNDSSAQEMSDEKRRDFTIACVLVDKSRSLLARIEDSLDRQHAYRKRRFQAVQAGCHAEGLTSDERDDRFRRAREISEALQSRREMQKREEWKVLYDLYSHLLPGAVRSYCLQLQQILDQEIVKFVYSIGSDGKPIYGEERLVRNGRTRETHSEQLGGKNMYGGGETIFARHREVFRTIEAWREFDAALRGEQVPRPWVLLELNNLSGHYSPSYKTLTYSQNRILPGLESVGISVKSSRVVDRLAPGLRLRERDGLSTFSS